MVKNLQKVGNSHAVLLDKALMDAAGITPDTQLQVTVSNGSITLTPVGVGIGPDEVARSIKSLRPRYGKMLKKLAE